MKKSKLVFAIMMLSLVSVITKSCKKEEPAKGTDRELYEMALETDGFTWYKNADALLPKSSITGHSETLIRTRYNATAAAELTVDGKVKDNTVFPDGSLIVKELYNNSNDLSTYAIQYKMNNHPDADADGWVWGYIRANGDVRDAASKKGSGCRGCHNQVGNINLTLMNKAFP